MAIMGRSMVETVSIILSAEEGKGEGRVVLAKPTIQTDIEHFFLLLLCKVAKASILDAFTSPLVLFNPGNERPPSLKIGKWKLVPREDRGGGSEAQWQIVIFGLSPIWEVFHFQG